MSLQESGLDALHSVNATSKLNLSACSEHSLLEFRGHQQEGRVPYQQKLQGIPTKQALMRQELPTRFYASGCARNTAPQKP